MWGDYIQLNEEGDNILIVGEEGEWELLGVEGFSKEEEQLEVDFALLRVRGIFCPLNIVFDDLCKLLVGLEEEGIVLKQVLISIRLDCLV